MNVFPQNIQSSSFAIPEAAYSLKRPNLGTGKLILHLDNCAFLHRILVVLLLVKQRKNASVGTSLE
jgi:hypothetical protein